MQPDDGNPPAADRALDGKALANAKLEQMRQRAGRIRRTIVVSTAGLFAAAFLGISVQLASGHDPALLAAAAKRSSSSTLKASTASGSDSSASTESEEGSSWAAESEESSPSSVTTSQS